MLSMICTSIPRHVTAFVGAFEELYMFWKDGRTIVVQVSSSVHTDLQCASKVIETHPSGLDQIRSVIDRLDFRSNWAYLVAQEDSFRFVYRNRPLCRMTCQTWAPLVEERDIIVTNWFAADLRHGTYNGREVDLSIGWSDTWLSTVEQETNGHRAILGLDISFEVIGHVVRDGQLVGLMTEPAYGRMIEMRDRAAVYDAVAKLQSRGLFIHCLHWSNIQVDLNGKVRFLGLAGLKSFYKDDYERLEKEAETCHWRTLENMFRQLEGLGSNPAQPYRYIRNRANLIPPPPSPGRSLIPNMSIMIRFSLYDEGAFEECRKAKRRTYHSRRLQNRKASPPPSIDYDDLELQVTPLLEYPISKPRHIRLRLHRSFHPYT